MKKIENSIPMHLYKPKTADEKKTFITGCHLTVLSLMQKLQQSGIFGGTMGKRKSLMLHNKSKSDSFFSAQ